VTWDEALTYATNLKTEGGVGGWRLPTIRELKAILHGSGRDPDREVRTALNILLNGVFWSGDSFVVTSPISEARGINGANSLLYADMWTTRGAKKDSRNFCWLEDYSFAVGNRNYCSNKRSMYVIPVREHPTHLQVHKKTENAPKKENNALTASGGSKGGDVWKDPQSGLTWQVVPTATGMNFSEAKPHCGKLSLGGYSDWRLPTINELRGLVRGCPATQNGGACGVTDSCLSRNCRKDICEGCSFNGGPGKQGIYWPSDLSGEGMCYLSSTVVEDSKDIGAEWSWGVDFGLGSIRSGCAAGSEYPYDPAAVRCVRR
jgi:hypothetical protein